MKMTSPRMAAAAALALLFATAARAQTGPELLLSTFAEGKNANVEADAVLLREGESDNGGEDFGLQIYNARGRFKLDLDRVVPGINRAQPRGGFDYTYLHVDDDAEVVPDDLTDASVAFGMGVFAQGDWVAGITVGVGHASSDSFDDANGWYYKADLAIGYTIDEARGEGFGLVINYDGNRTFLPDVPLPGFLYRRRLNDQFRIGLGFPFSEVIYEPDEKFNFRLRYNIPDRFEAEAAYKFTDSLGVFAQYRGISEAFHSDALDDPDDRILFQQQRVEAGVRGGFRDTFNVVAAVGYAFDQQFEVGFDTRDADEIAEPSDEPYVRFAIEARF